MAMQDRVKKARATTAPAATFRRPTGRASFPHRKTIDFDTEQWTWLNNQAYESRISAAALVRAALAYVADRDDVLADVVEAATDAERGT